MQLVRERQASFARGANDQAAPDEYAENEVALLENGYLTLNGNGARRRDGSQQTHSSALNSGAQCYGTFYFSAQDQHIAFFGDTGYYSTDDGSTWTQMATGLRTDYWDIVETDVCGTQEIVLANGSSDIYTWDGSTWGTLSGSARPTGVKYLAVFNGRLYVAGHDGDSVAASEVADFSTWAGADGGISVKVTTHDGDVGITGLYQIGTALLIFKRNSTNYLEGFGHRTLTLEAGARGMSRSVGCLGFRTIAPLGDDAVVWLSDRGVEGFSGGGRIQLLSRPVHGLIDSIDRDVILSDDGVPVGAYWQERDEYWLAVPTSGSENDTILVLRDETSRTPLAFWQHDPSFNVAALMLAKKDNAGLRPYAGGYDGFLREMETGDLDDRASDGTGGSNVTMKLRTRPFLYGLQQVYRRGRIARAAIEASSQASVDFKVLADGAVASTVTETIPANSGPVSHKARLNGRGHNLQVELETTDAPIIQGVELGAENLRRGW